MQIVYFNNDENVYFVNAKSFRLKIESMLFEFKSIIIIALS